MSGAGDIGYGYGHDRSMPGGRQPYRGDGYDEYMDPTAIADDADDTYDDAPRRPRSRFGIGAAAAGTGAAAGGGAHVMQALGQRDPSGNYGPVGGNNTGTEKSEWLKNEGSARKKRKWIAIGILAFLVLGGIAGGLAYYFIHRNSSSSSGGEGSSSHSSSNGVWGLDSPEVQAVLNNKNLHKVFPGMDYTPYNAQYPACLSNMPFQNDVTVDVAILAQLTPAIRLYGTDCQQTEMVLKGIDLLGYNDTVKIWLGVYLDGNSTTNNRQLNQMYDILDKYPSSHFAGVIVGNEVLFSEYLTETQLASYLTKVRQQLSSRGIDLPVSTADLGDNWTTGLAADSDIVMANVHPFFAGKTPAQAPGWTLNFWNTHDVILKTDSGGAWPANIISETGWPTQGGNDCGTGAKCPTKTEGAIAGIDELNEYMEGWVCQQLAKKTIYFW
jgi:exo-beta-1,3-glucanase (GH17 family)